jgi:AcrR family transcriptional regulator
MSAIRSGSVGDGRMTAMATTSRPGRPTRAAAAELEDRLRRAAFETFLANGFDGTTMEAVATAAGISKRTLYAKYPDKRALFATVLPWATSTLEWDESVAPAGDGDLATELLNIARAALARAVDPNVVQLLRIGMSEVDRFPEFAESARTMAWSERHRTVVELLERHVESGDVTLTDPDLAAELFLAWVSAFPMMLAAFGVRWSTRERERHLKHAVTLFLSGVLPRPA